MSEDRRPDGDLDGETLDRSAGETRAHGTEPPRSSTRKSLLAPGQTFGGYRLSSLLGKGGFGQVWEAESLETGRRLALKVLTETAGLDDSARQRFEREGRLAAAVSHARCVYVFGAEEIDGHPAISMELVPGGTLQDEVKRRGALPFREAVDRVLDVLEGLEAAYEKGVIHRDVKPSNCFLDATGRTKIGDFGLSRTLEVDTKLTTTGVFMGTPAYSSPEQVRAEVLDFRADLYSAGATLYTLLAGDVPFQGTQLGPVLARILSEPPPPLSRSGVKVPAGLERVVQRLMAKERERRYASYEAARAALLPYSSQGLTAASLAKRFAAVAIDSVIMTPFSLLIMGASHSMVAPQLLSFTYYLVLEGRWGSSLGKRLFGLRVVSAAGGEAGWGAVALRTTIYVLFAGLPAWSRLFLSEGATSAFTRAGGPAFVMVAAYAALASSMRRRNAFAGLHELASRTRVVALPERRAASKHRAAASFAGQLEGAERFGPFVVQRLLWQADGESVALASDPVLGRPVFVHRVASARAARPIPFLAESGTGRLHWLQGSREEGRAWDAFEAPDGLAFVDWVKDRGRRSWSEVAGVLSAVIPEMERRRESEEDSPPLSLDRVWVDGLGQGRLLDFVLRDPARPEAAEAFPAEQWRPFLKQLLLLALEGRRVRHSELAGSVLRVPLAERAGVAVGMICGGGPVASPQALSEPLAASLLQPAEVNPARRGAALAIAATWPAFAMSGWLTLTFWGGPVIEFIGLKGALHKWHAPADSGAAPAVATARREALEEVLAHYYRKVKERADAQGASRVANPVFGAIDARNQLASLSAEDRLLLESASSRHPPLSPEGLLAAERTSRVKVLTRGQIGAMVAIIWVWPGALAGVLLAGLSRGGVALRLGGIAVRKADGTLPSRLRCLWRGLVAWLPLLLPFPLAVLAGLPWLFPLAVAGLAVALAGAIFALVRPARGLHDLAAGTHLVPK